MQRCKGPRVVKARCFRRSISLKDLSDYCPTVSYGPFWLLTLIFPVLAFFFPGLSLCPPLCFLFPPLGFVFCCLCPFLSFIYAFLGLLLHLLSFSLQQKLYGLSIPSFCLATVG